MAVRIDGQIIDMPDAVRGFQRFTSNDRADRAANFRMTQGQRQSIGEAFWTHEFRPGVCFPTRIEARRAALEVLAAPVPSLPE